MRKSPLLPIFLIVFIDLLGFGLILPLLPFYAESFGASGFVVGLLIASYSLMQFIGAPILGRLSDKWGRRPVLLLSQFGTFAGFIVLGLANSLPLLFLGRIIDGISGANLSTAQAYISDVTEEKDRAKSFGLIGAAFGLGFILGPAAGGWLSTFGYQVPAFVAAGLSALTMVLTYIMLPEPARKAGAAKARPAFSIDALKRAVTHPAVGSLLTISLTFGVAFTMFQTSFALFAASRLGFSQQETGFMLAYVGLLSVIMQVVVVSRLVKKLGERQSLVLSIGALALGLGLMAVVQTPLALIAVMPILSFGGGATTPVLTSLITKSVDRTEVGGMLGITTSVDSAGRVIAPIIGNSLLAFNNALPSLAGAALLLIPLYIAFKLRNNGVPVMVKPAYAEAIATIKE
ncbi:MAG: MFS transporter [Thermoflexales bacterium]|nr:MFS transporter [Thermoflexales bacterium]